MQNNPQKKKTRKIRKPSTRAESALQERIKASTILRPIEIALLSEKMVIGLMIALMSLLSVVALSGYVIKTDQRNYIIVDENGATIKEQLITNEALVDRAEVAARVDECIRETFDLDFKHWKASLVGAAHCYTDKGFNETAFNIDDQGIAREITKTNSIATLTPDTLLTVTDIGRENGAKTMEFTGDYIYTLSHNTKDNSLRNLVYDVTVIAKVKEVPITKSPYKFQIDRINFVVKVQGL